MFRINFAEPNNRVPTKNGRSGQRVSLHLYDEKLLKKLILSLDNSLVDDKEIRAIIRSLRRKLINWP